MVSRHWATIYVEFDADGEVTKKVADEMLNSKRFHRAICRECGVKKVQVAYAIDVGDHIQMVERENDGREQRERIYQEELMVNKPGKNKK